MNDKGKKKEKRQNDKNSTECTVVDDGDWSAEGRADMGLCKMKERGKVAARSHTFPRIHGLSMVWTVYRKPSCIVSIYEYMLRAIDFSGSKNAFTSHSAVCFCTTASWTKLISCAKVMQTIRYGPGYLVFWFMHRSLFLLATCEYE